MSRKMLFRLSFVFFLFLGMSVRPALAVESLVKMRVVVINPSADKAQTKSVKSYLPQEITLGDIKDFGGLEVDYDTEQGLFYAYKNDVPLAPSETKTFELLMKDIWTVSQEKLDGIKTHAEQIMEHLKGTPYFKQADLVVKEIYGRLENIVATQNDANVTRQQHIAYYRDNLRALEAVKTDIDKLEKILVTVGGPPNPELMEKSDVNLKSPSSKTAWLIIFIVLIFLAVLGGAFYFTWIGQAKITENIFTKAKEESFNEFKHPEPSGDDGGTKKKEPPAA